MNIETVGDFRRAIRQGPRRPGGYPVFFITSDGAALSYAAAKAEKRNVLWSIGHKMNDGWRIIGADINWEDQDLTCDHTGQLIESAYGAD